MTPLRSSSADRSGRPWLEAARRTASWLEEVALPMSGGRVWPAAPSVSSRPVYDLYSGSAGIVLFFLDLHQATSDPHYLDLARSASRPLIDHLREPQSDPLHCALYAGIAGVGFALEEAHASAMDPNFREGSRLALARILDCARDAGQGIEWNGQVDIINGSAGTGLFLLYAANRLHEPAARTMAELAGLRLVELATPVREGLAWLPDDPSELTMPNFSHGTAGIAYFLATLFLSSGDHRFLAAAIEGARHLTAIADREDGGFQVHHSEPCHRELYYQGWCHGPVGTSRLFWRLWQATGDIEWLRLVQACRKSVRGSTHPGRRSGGLWNNVGLCCGDAGIVEFFLDMHAHLASPDDLDTARKMAAVVLEGACVERGMLSFPVAENRSEPERVAAQTGYMQGAAGIGAMFLRLDARLTGRPRTIRLPDSPFAAPRERRASLVPQDAG